MSILARTCGALAAATLSWGQVNVSGTLYDYLDGKAIPGATVRLTSAAGLSGERITDSTGKFSFTAPSSLPAPEADLSPGIARNGQGFHFRQGADGHVDVRIHSLTGRGSVPVFTGRLGAGLWRIGQPRLPAGVYLCRVRTPAGEHTTRFLAADFPAGPQAGFPERIGSPAWPGAGATKSGAMAKRGAAPARSDSLSISKPGYHPRNVALDTLWRGGTLYLTDTAIGKTATLVPHSSWHCNLPTGIAPPMKGAAVFQATLTLGAIYPVGITPYGYRRLLDVSGGTLAGTRINGTVHKGGLDLELTQRDGTVEIEQILVLRTGDGANIYVRGLGISMPGDPRGRVVLDFEAPTSGAYAWLNSGTYVATRVVDAAAKTVKLEVFDVANVTPGNPRINFSDPGGASNQQSADCLTLTGARGTSVFTENVTLGASFSIAGKRGSRNIIPITGGTTSGRVVGKVLPGGADYQLNGLDARYTLAPNDGEYILVRNCGPMNGLVPRFEARVAGPYNFLNANNFLSSEPGVVGSAVNITFYQRQ